MKALLVVDVQEDVMRGRKTEGLIESCNAVISRFATNQVFYIANIRPFAKDPIGNPMANGLDVVSHNVFFKRQPNAFSNTAFLSALHEQNVDEVEIIGIDGNWCIKATAFGALRNNLKVSVNTSAVVSKNPKAFRLKTVPRLERAGVEIVST